MDFSQCQRSSVCPIYAQDSFQSYLASSMDFRVVIRESQSLQVKKVFSCLDRVKLVRGAPQGGFILAMLKDRPVVQVIKVSDTGMYVPEHSNDHLHHHHHGGGGGEVETTTTEEEEWTCRITEGAAGIGNAFWGPTSRHVITLADFNVRMSIWSLEDRSCVHVKFPKLSTRRGFDFSPDGSFMCVARRRRPDRGSGGRGKDMLLVMDTKTWEAVAEFEVCTSDLASVAWSPTGSCIAVCDAAVEGSMVASYSPDGRCLGRFEAHGPNQLGVRSMSWSPDGSVLAVAGYDGVLRLVAGDTWEQACACEHDKAVSGPSGVVIYEEEEGDKRPRYDVVASLPYKIRQIAASTAMPTQSKRGASASAGGGGTSSGIRLMEWSRDGAFVASVTDETPGAVWLWSASTRRLVAVLVHGSRVECMRWDPRRARLAIVCGGERVYVWTEEGASLIRVPVEEVKRATTVAWDPSGESITVFDKDASVFCCCFIV